MKKFFLVFFIFSLFFSHSEAITQKEISLTVYNKNFALIKDIREIQVLKGLNEIRFKDVPSLIEPESVLFKPLTQKFPVYLLEQNYEFDLLNPGKLLRKYIEKKISVTGKDNNTFEGVLKSFQNNTLILESKKGNFLMLKMENVKTILFPSLEGLITQPTLVWWIKSGRRGKLNIEVSYITKRINWKADYVVRIGEKEKNLDLKGWVTLNNQCGATFNNANLKLVAGEVHIVEKKLYRRWEKPMMLEKGGAFPQQFKEKPFFEYHLYTLKRKTTLKNNQIKQVSLLQGSHIPFKKIYSYDGLRNKKKVEVYVEFKNSLSNNLGIPLPKGKVRVYKVEDNNMEFVGEDEIDHTPKDENIKLLLGNAFDIIGERKTLKREKLAKNLWESTYQISLRNHKKEKVEIEVIEHLWGDWKITSSSHKWIKKDAQTIKFIIEVKGNSEEKILYTVRYKW